MKLPILIAMVLYMAMVVWIGVFYSRKTKTSEDYFLGGRGLGPWVTAMSAEASDMSSWIPPYVSVFPYLPRKKRLTYVSRHCTI